MEFCSKISFCLKVTDNFSDGLKLIFYTISTYFIYKLKKELLSKINKIITLTIIENRKKYNIKLRLQDIEIFYEIFYHKAYRLNGLQQTEGAILDIGAHIGLTTIFFHSQIEENLRHVCIEPSIRNYKLLRYNVKNIKCETLNIGISNFNGTANFSNNTQFLYNYKILKNKNHRGDTVKVMTIEDLLSSQKIYKISICKIDVEGEEKNIFNSNIQWLSKTNNLLIELHDSFTNSEVSDLIRTEPSWKNLSVSKQGDVYHFKKSK